MTHRPTDPSPEPAQLMRVLASSKPRHELERRLSDERVVEAVLSPGGVNKPLIVRLESGLIGYFKSFARVNMPVAMQFGQANRISPVLEVVAWRVADLIGPRMSDVVQPVVPRDLPFHGGAGALSLEGLGSNDNLVVFEDEELVKKCAFFDCLIGQQDRHRGNFKFESAQNRLALFDHGFAFALPGDRLNSSLFVETCHVKGWSGLDRWQIEFLEQMCDSGDLLGLASVLPEDRSSALCQRADRMLSSGSVLPLGDF